ncbi:MAG: hypothetical protein ACD_67C00055G0006 [uncultured bacterium]|nr:MAG: hypothetical protein ACD_67C00055G0006 [uncultured bacterium]
MLINVPQYIDVEDKIVGPLTAKQLGWIIALSVILLVLWNMVPAPVFFILGLPISILFVALAFFKPYGQPLGSFVIFGIMYFFRPKVYVWKRTPQNIIVATQKTRTQETIAPDKHLTSASLRDLAQLLDSEGMNANNDVEKILKPVPMAGKQPSIRK